MIANKKQSPKAATVKIKDIVLGEGLPKIAVPNVGKNEEEIIASAKEIVQAEPDLMEWRIDYYSSGIKHPDQLLMTAHKLRQEVKLPILVTFRTKNEGGECVLADDLYFDLIKTIIENHLGDAVDIELLHDEKKVQQLVNLARDNQVITIMSNHDFAKMPSKDTILSRLKKMVELGADVPKFAGMPHDVNDVLTLLTATTEAHETLARPLITMAMGDIGKVTRISGQVFGSSLSFGTVGKTSAPGQLTIRDLRASENYLKV